MGKFLAGVLCFAGLCLAQDVFITVDQFGYRPGDPKVAVLRSPEVGSDSALSYTPSESISVIDSATGVVAFTGAVEVFNEGVADSASGDKIWWFDFSSVTKPGTYFIADKANSMQSFNFRIAEDVYNDVLKAALRVLFYQRVGFEKSAAYAGADYADGASHLQDANTNSFFDKNNAATARDLSGAWYDAGDYNKYSAWVGNYIETLLLAYLSNPEAFTDDYNIPESGNGIPDILDEVKWGLDFLRRAQNEDGSVLSVVGLDSESPPSASLKPSYYGPANAIATLAATKAFAIASIVANHIGKPELADSLANAAQKAWDWAEAHPDSMFHNNSADNNSQGLAAGDQEETGEAARLENRMNAAMHMYNLTGKREFLEIFEQNYQDLPLYRWSDFVDQYRNTQHLMYVRYLTTEGADDGVKSELSQKFMSAFKTRPDAFATMIGKDGYRSYIQDYNWGSNLHKVRSGLVYDAIAKSGYAESDSLLYTNTAIDYLHYIHGVNPFGMVYLTNMKSYGATKSATTIYHGWFEEGTKWDYTSDSTIGPAPGFLPGGPNNRYTWDACCDNKSCGSTSNNNMCYAIPLLKGEPSAKMYKEFNNGWPLNSWSVTEPSLGYQTFYISLLSRFVEKKGKPLGPQKIKPMQKPATSTVVAQFKGSNLEIHSQMPLQSVAVFDLQNREILKQKLSGNSATINLSSAKNGIYFVKVSSGSTVSIAKVIKN